MVEAQPLRTLSKSGHMSDGDFRGSLNSFTCAFSQNSVSVTRQPSFGLNLILIEFRDESS